MMNTPYKALAFDFGASSGRAICGAFDGESITLKELHRFQNDPVNLNGTLYWDILRLFHEVKQGLLSAKHDGGFDSVGVDTWGVDFGLVDKDGYLLENPVHYRDARTSGILTEAAAIMSPEELYRATGSQFMEINTAFQLLSLVQNRPALLERTESLLLMPDLFNYLLTGHKAAEYSIASTTQLMEAGKGVWSKKVLDAFRIPQKILPEIVPGGTTIGRLSEGIMEELDVPPAEVIAVAGHDTQCAMLAVPAAEKDFLFISCGTWSLLGTELDKPVINKASLSLNITNEGGFGGRTSFLKNIIGLWLLQESRRQWKREGQEYSFMELEQRANAGKPFQCFIDPDAPEFVPSGNIPKRIREYCKKTEQYVPQTTGEIVRCIYESLALKYRIGMEEISCCTGKNYATIYMVGGGTKDITLCQMTADACGCTVCAGPVEATVLGNVAIQLIASGQIPDTKTARAIIRRSQNIKTLVPNKNGHWEKAYQDFKTLLSR